MLCDCEPSLFAKLAIALHPYLTIDVPIIHDNNTCKNSSQKAQVNSILYFCSFSLVIRRQGWL